MDIYGKLVIIILLLIANTLFGAGSISVDQDHTNHKITNARVVPRVATAIGSSGAPTINTDNYDAVTFTAISTNITSLSSGLSGTPTNFQKLIFRFKDDGTPRSITWGASFVSSQATLPTTTVAGKVTTVGVQWDSVKGKWVCLAVDREP